MSGGRAERTTHGVPEEAGGHSNQQLQWPLSPGSHQNSYRVETESSHSSFWKHQLTKKKEEENSPQGPFSRSYCNTIHCLITIIIQALIV